MAKYNGSVDLISGLRPKNNGTFPLMEAKDIQTSDDGTRLNTELKNIKTTLSILRPTEKIADSDINTSEKRGVMHISLFTGANTSKQISLEQIKGLNTKIICANSVSEATNLSDEDFILLEEGVTNG